MTDRETMQMALVALNLPSMKTQQMLQQRDEAIAALRAALAEEALQRLTNVQQEIEAALEQPEQKPYAEQSRRVEQETQGRMRINPVTGDVSIGSPPPPQQAEPPICAWSPEDDDSGTYRSACGELWSFIDGGWQDNHVRFCHGCGGRVIEAKLKEKNHDQR